MMLSSKLFKISHNFNSLGASTFYSLKFQPFARYMNRAQTMAHEYKYDPTSFMYKPNLIYSIDPAPHYPEADPNPKQRETLLRDQTKRYYEHIRDNAVQKNKMSDNFMYGRLNAHVRHEDLKAQIQQTHDGEKKFQEKKQRKALKSKDGITFEMVEIEDTFQLPYGVGYDHFIKQKTDLLNKQKIKNYEAMNELVEKIGYMDYRDALACNKYILEAKRHGDYHQQARAQILKIAMVKFNQQRKEEIDKMAAQHPAAATDKEEAKFQTILNIDPDLARDYRFKYEDIKEEKEFEEQEADRVFERYDYQFYNEYKSDVIPAPQFEIKNMIQKSDDDVLSSDYTDLDEQMIQRRLKYIQINNQKSMKDIRENLIEQKMNFSHRKLKVDGKPMKNLDKFEMYQYRQYQQIKEREKIDMKMESLKAEMLLNKTLSKINPQDILNENDAYFPGEIIEDNQFAVIDSNLPLEFRKLYSMNHQQLQNLNRMVTDQESGELVEDYENIIKKYYRAKADHYVNKKLEFLVPTTLQLHYEEQEAELNDQAVNGRAYFMYNNMDFYNDRDKAREKFIQNVNRRTTLQDIGRMLDKFILDDQGGTGTFHDYTKGEGLKKVNKDYTSFDFHWTKGLFDTYNGLSPTFGFDDRDPAYGLPEGVGTEIRDIFKRVDFEDAQRDHSYSALTKDERDEITLFNSFKQDPYFKHYLKNHLRQYAEESDDFWINQPFAPSPTMIDDFVKFDRINLYDFRRALAQKEREAKLDVKGRAWGFGKRKSSRAVARVKPGKGTITVNGEPILNYFHSASQRYRILLPLTLTRYTCILDVDIWVHGGGTTGQCEACVPAIAKALQNYDVKTRLILKYFKLMRHDPRNVERKKYGRIKARKGQVYRRR